MRAEALMAKRTNRVAWGLAVVLAVVVAVGGVVLVAHYQSGLPERERHVKLLPWRDWWFGSEGMALLSGPKITYYKRMYSCGFFLVEIEQSPPAELVNSIKQRYRAPASTPSGPGR
jgi:hypothetical protein